MSLRKSINKSGSYILETTISLPVFLIAIIVMNSIILMFSCIERSNFVIANELRRGAYEAIYANSSAMIPYRTTEEIRKNSLVSNLDISDYGYDLSWWGNDHLIALKIRMNMSAQNPINLGSNASYDVALVTRAYVGKERNVEKMSEAEMMNENATPVYIFPKHGEKYHTEGCTFLHAATKAAALSESIKSKYSPCMLCHSKNAKLGATIYYFPADGESYHLPGCATIERNYIEISKEVAIERGYTSCSKCGG